MKAHVIAGSDRRSLAEMRRWFKLLCAVLHNDFGFGAGRLDAVIDGISRLSDDQKGDPIFWEHMDRLLIDQLGIKFDRENYKEVDK
ncbi:hypothetical protein [Caproicibacter fermentans]|uniref:Uncharacterized protein n=1 Tax=Caproicibacter fermentans TaxID=2576756 RepID=A0A7G8TE00_9FIRM|nr:hypothetical protein [Caproicibacter fermentans]QNK41841.1 hypothetical protein HCR03_06255 [Caproicibacter fermentans]